MFGETVGKQGRWTKHCYRFSEVKLANESQQLVLANWQCTYDQQSFKDFRCFLFSLSQEETDYVGLGVKKPGFRSCHCETYINKEFPDNRLSCLLSSLNLRLLMYKMGVPTNVPLFMGDCRERKYKQTVKCYLTIYCCRCC